MKRVLFFIFLAIFCGSLWSADFSLSTGTGGLVGGLFTRYKANSSTGSGEMTQNVNQVNYGGLLFFDATYAELAVILQAGANNYSEVMSNNNTMIPMAGDGWETMLGLSLLGKYPFALTKRFGIFPLLGIDYQISLLQRRRPTDGLVYNRTDGMYADIDKDNKPYDISVWNSFWINLGVGTDFHIAKRIFLRGELLYGFRLMTSYESDGLEKMKVMLNDNDPKLGGLTSGPSLRLSAGYRFLGT